MFSLFPFLLCVWGVSVAISKWSINADGGLGGEFTERTNSAHSIPRVPFAWPLTFAFVSFQKTGNEGFASQRGQSHAAGLAVIDDHVRILESDHFDDGARLWRVISDFVAVPRRDRLRAGQPHQRVAVSRRQIDSVAQQLFHREARVLRREFGPAGEDAGDSRLSDGGSEVLQRLGERFEQFWRREHTFD